MLKFFLPAFLIGSTLFAQKVITAGDAVRIALNRNVSVQKSTENLKISESNQKTSYGALLPSLNGSAGWSYSKSTSEISTTAGKSTLTTDSRNFNLGVAAEATLYDGLSNFADYEQSKHEFGSAKFSLEKLRQDIIFQTLSGFYDILNAKKLLEVKKEDLKWNQKNLEIINERNRLGAATLADVYQQQVKVGSAELELIRSQNSVETLTNNFIYYLGLDNKEDISFEDSKLDAELNAPQSRDTSFGKLSDMIEQALRNRPDFLSLKEGLLSANEGLLSAKGGYMPRVAGSLGYGFAAPLPGDVFKNRNLSAGLSVQVPIFTGWKIDSRVEIAEVGCKIKELEISDLSRSIRKDLQKNLLDLETARKQIGVGSSNVKAAEENRRIEQEKYSLGSTTLLNVLIANSEYTNAVTGLINAKYEYRKLFDQAEYLLGKLNSKKFE